MAQSSPAATPASLAAGTPARTVTPAEKPSPGQVVLLRHGLTEWSMIGRHTSFTDLDVTPAGAAGAVAIPGLLRSLRIAPSTVLVSPRLRARHTAELAGLHVDGIEQDLVEWDYGDYEGRTTAEIHGERPDWQLFRDGCPGGESPTAVAERVDRLLVRVRQLAARGDVALVCHGHISRAITVRWVGLPISAGALIALDESCATVLGEHGGEPVIRRANVPAPRRRDAGG